MQWMTTSEIRTAFLTFFQNKGHQIVPSSSLIPHNDRTLLFTNAGMVQFKETFLGLEPRSYVRAASAQRCVRAGGKHNDLDNVGYTARHHTFFEMLGHFSFGDYFKKEAIEYAWSFLTEQLQLPKERLWVTVFETDDEAADLWLHHIGISPERLSRCGEKDNFWSMGDTGPCGPCTEIFYDHGPEIAGGPPGSPEADGDRYIEIWNLVFMQFNRDEAGVLHPLPKPSVDTGMGLERIAAVMQGVHNNYDIDIFSYLIRSMIQHHPQLSLALDHPSLKVIADHIRACAFLILDGVFPSNEGRGYVLRRIIRRAVRHGHQLGLPVLFFSKMVAPLIDVMGEAYPELKTQHSEIERVLSDEEIQFEKTLAQGLHLFKQAVEGIGEAKIISGEIAFKLYDTYGFPLDLVVDLARERGLSVDLDAFNRAMAEQRKKSQASNTFKVVYEATEANRLTEKTDFVGYYEDKKQTHILYCEVNGKAVEQLSMGDAGFIVLEATPFYPESGGQVGDQGTIYSLSKEAIFHVKDTQKVGQTILHYGEVTAGVFQQRQAVMAEIDLVRRQSIRLNHTATHLLHAALRQLLGSSVEQKGSLVEASRARFDFKYHQPLTTEQLLAIETLIFEKILENHPVQTDIMSVEDALQSGAMALFGEKYAEAVRVLSIDTFSKELCGGTHASRTGDLGLFKVIAESGVASGVRRIEFITGQEAMRCYQAQSSDVAQMMQQLKVPAHELVTKIESLLKRLKEQEKHIEWIKKNQLLEQGKQLLKQFKHTPRCAFLIETIEGLELTDLRALMDQLRTYDQPAVIILLGILEDRLNVLAYVHPVLKEIVPTAASFVQRLCGRGGGRSDLAQGGGIIPDHLAQIIEEIKCMFE